MAVKVATEFLKLQVQLLLVLRLRAATGEKGAARSAKVSSGIEIPQLVAIVLVKALLYDE